MKVGDIIWDRIDERYGLLVSKDWESSIGTPFDWCALWFENGTLWGVDTRHIVVVTEEECLL